LRYLERNCQVEDLASFWRIEDLASFWRIEDLASFWRIEDLAAFWRASSAFIVQMQRLWIPAKIMRE
jgi:hypothetical protein